MVERRRRGPQTPLAIAAMAQSQLAKLRKTRGLLEDARVISRNLADQRRMRLETTIGQALDEAERQIEELRALQG